MTQPEKQQDKQSVRERIVISIESQKGGTGKSMVALLLAKELKTKGFQTLVIDADITGTALVGVVGSNLYPKDLYHSVLATKEKSNAYQLSESKEANFFSDYDVYIKQHLYPCFQLEGEKTNDTGQFGRTLNVRKGVVNVYGSEFDGAGEIKKNGAKGCDLSGIEFNGLYSRWLLRFIKHICAQFAKSFEKEDVAIIIDNSPGNAGIITELRQWLTDMGPSHGKFVIVTTLDIRDLKACQAELQKIREMYEKKCATAKYYRSLLDEKIECSDSFDEDFYQCLYECEFHLEKAKKTFEEENAIEKPCPYDAQECEPPVVADEGPGTQHRCPRRSVLNYEWPFLKYTQIHYLCDNFLGHATGTLDPKVRSQFFTVLINKVPTDLFVGNTLSSHDAETFKSVRDFFESTGMLKNMGIDEKDRSDRSIVYPRIKRHLVFREPLLAYAHLDSNKSDGAAGKMTQDIKYRSLEIQGAKHLCAILQNDLNEVIEYFHGESVSDDLQKLNSWLKTWRKSGKKNTSVEEVCPQRPLEKLDLLNKTMNRLRAILFPFAHKDLSDIFLSNSTEDRRGEHLTPVHALLRQIVKFFDMMSKKELGSKTEEPLYHKTLSELWAPRPAFMIMDLSKDLTGSSEAVDTHDHIDLQDRMPKCMEFMLENMGQDHDRMLITLPLLFFFIVMTPNYNKFLEAEKTLKNNEGSNDTIIIRERLDNALKNGAIKPVINQIKVMMKFRSGAGQEKNTGENYHKVIQTIKRQTKETNDYPLYSTLFEIAVRFYDLVADTAFILSSIAHGSKFKIGSEEREETVARIERVTGFSRKGVNDLTLPTFIIAPKKARAVDLFNSCSYDVVKPDILENFEEAIKTVLERLHLQSEGGKGQ